MRRARVGSNGAQRIAEGKGCGVERTRQLSGAEEALRLKVARHDEEHNANILGEGASGTTGR